MALTLTHLPEFQDVFGSTYVLVYDVTGDSSYPAGGEAVDPDKDLGFGAIIGAVIIGANAVAARLMAVWDTTNNKLQVLYPSGGSAASPAALADPLATVVTGALATADPTAAMTPGRGKEVLATTDLTTCTWRVIFYCQ